MPEPPASQPPANHRNGVLFLCVANSARSQMAEGFARLLAPAQIRVYSAGSQPGALNPHAVRAMKEVGIDISASFAKGLEEVPLDDIGTVITLCSEEECPVLPGELHHLHWPLPDPAAVTGTEEDILLAFRRVRDQIRELVSRLF